jgi:hypothetical protein
MSYLRVPGENAVPISNHTKPRETGTLTSITWVRRGGERFAIVKAEVIQEKRASRTARFWINRRSSTYALRIPEHVFEAAGADC